MKKQLVLNERVIHLPASPTLRLGELVKQKQAAGADIVNMTVGEPEFATPAVVQEAAIEALKAKNLGYPSASGILELRAAIAKKFADDNGINYSSEEILVGVGSKHLLSVALQVLTNPGDEVLIPVPAWGSYMAQVELVGAVPRLVEMEAPFVPTATLLEEAASDKVKVLMLNYPGNPTGKQIPKVELEKIAALAVERGWWVISDEIYEKLTFAGSHVSIAGLSEAMREQTLTINGVSKAYAMTGWRLGYAGGPVEVIEAMSRVVSQTVSGVNVIAQHAAVAALEGEIDFSEINQCYKERMQRGMLALSAIDGVRVTEPDGGLYLWVEVPTTETIALCERLVEEYGVAVVPGEAFAMPGYVRVGLAVEDERFDEGVRRLKRGLENF